MSEKVSTLPDGFVTMDQTALVKSTGASDSYRSDDVESHGTDSTQPGINEAAWDLTRTKALLWKLDTHLLPFLALLYLLSFLDRTNIGNGKLADLEEDLGINPNSIEFNTAVAVFFPWYVAAEIPSNLAMKRFRPSIWIPSIMVAWGICCLAMGFVTSYAGLLIARSAMGLAEGGLFPGVTYYITLWYRRNECGLRMALFFSAATAAGAFGGLLARGIVELDGAHGLGGWSWIFIIEGAVTIVIALSAYWAMYDYPETAKFLKENERTEVLRRLEADRSVLADEFHMKYFIHAIKDWKIYLHMLITIGLFIPLYSIATFMPSIVSDLGFANEQAQLMSVPPYFAACIACIAAGWGADRTGRRGIFMVVNCMVALVGFAILIGTRNNAARYFACFLVTCGIYANVSQGVAWCGNNIGGSTKRGVGIAMQVGFGNLGGAVAGYVYRPNKYYEGHIILFATTAFSLFLCIFQSWWLRRENARRDAAYKRPSEYTHEEMFAQRERGDGAEFFRYVF